MTARVSERRKRAGAGTSRNLYETDPATSRRMSAVRPLDTAPEKTVRSVLTKLGFRYRLNRYDLPGRPDVVLAARREAIFVHGCFWHRHPQCRKTTMPSRNEALWREKFGRTLERDQQNRRRLEDMGWKVLVIWECETSNPDRASRILQSFLEPRLDELCESA